MSAFHVLWRFIVLCRLISTRRRAVAFRGRSILWCGVAAGVCSRQHGRWAAEVRVEDSLGLWGVSAFFT